MVKDFTDSLLRKSVDDIFELIQKYNLLTPEELPKFKKSFYLFLLHNNFHPFTDDEDFFYQQIEKTISSFSKEKISYSFLESELKGFFKPIPEKPWFKFFSKYHFVFVLFVSLSSLMLQIFKSK